MAKTSPSLLPFLSFQSLRVANPPTTFKILKSRKPRLSNFSSVAQTSAPFDPGR